MRIRSFKGSSLERIYGVIHDELGPDAVIINSRRRSRTGIPGFSGKDAYEVIAVVDDDAESRHIAEILASAGADARNSDASAQIVGLSRICEAMREEMRAIAGKIPATLPPPVKDELPSFASDWYQPFLNKLAENRHDFLAISDRTAQRAALRPLIPVEENFVPPARDAGPAVLALIGPTGSGKTTTLAKLAARWSLSAGMKVGIITTDTYRVAAVDQIREYASLLGIELKVAFSPAEASRALRSFAAKDVVLVDTVGRSHRDKTGIAALRGLMYELGDLTSFLVVPATWDSGTVREMVGNFAMPSAMRLVISKIDESRRFGMLTHVFGEKRHQVVFLTNGQRVPQDIVSAKAENIAELLVPAEEGVTK